MNKVFSFAVTAIAAFILSGCGNNLPEIKQIYSQLNISKNSESDELISELVVFVSVDDEDGADDIESIHIINESRQLFWSVDSSSWVSRDSLGMKWVGYEKLLTADGGLPEAGEYRVLVADRAGERVESSIFIPALNELPAIVEFPQLNFMEDSDYVDVESPENDNVISFYDNEGKLIGAFGVTPGRLNIRKLKDGAAILKDYKEAEISYYSNKFGAGMISGPFSRLNGF